MNSISGIKLKDQQTPDRNMNFAYQDEAQRRNKWQVISSINRNGGDRVSFNKLKKTFKTKICLKRKQISANKLSRFK